MRLDGGGLLHHNLHYEGTPGLWHVWLKLLGSLHLSFNVARWLSAALEAAGMAVLLRWAPFPRVLRLLLPFGFFFAYQDGVIVRSYLLFAILAFPAAALLRARRARPVVLAIFLGLLANVSLHGVLLSGGIAIVAAILWGRQWLRNAPAMALLLVFWMGAVATLGPAFDIDYEAGNNIRREFAKAEQSVGIRAEMPPKILELPMYGLRPAPEPVHIRRGFKKTWHKLARVLGVISYPITQPRSLALLVFAALILQAMVFRRGLRGAVSGMGGPSGASGLVPYCLMVLVFTSLYIAPRHAGTVWTGFVVSAWLTWPRREDLTTPARQWTTRVAATLLTLAALVQIAWTGHALWEERKLPYAADRMTAEYLKQGGAGTTASAAGFYYFSNGALLYFPRNIYINQPPHRYWLWSTDMRTYMSAQDVLARHPRYLVLGGFVTGPESEITADWQPISPPQPGVVLGDEFSVRPWFEAHGYGVTHIFCGHTWMRLQYAEQLCNTVMEPTAAAQ